VYGGGGRPLELLEPVQSRSRMVHLHATRGLLGEGGQPAGYSSPACYAAEFPGYFGEDDGDGKPRG
jgi:hypothetical protein